MPDLTLDQAILNTKLAAGKLDNAHLCVARFLNENQHVVLDALKAHCQAVSRANPAQSAEIEEVHYELRMLLLDWSDASTQLRLAVVAEARAEDRVRAEQERPVAP